VNNEENNTIEQENQEVQVVEVPAKKKKDKIFVILAVIVFIITAGLLFMLVTKTGDGQSTVFQRVFNLDMSKLDKERKVEESKEEIIEEPQQEEPKETPVTEDKNKTEDKKSSNKTNNKTNEKNNANSNKDNSNNNSGSSSSAGNSTISREEYIRKNATTIHYGFIGLPTNSDFRPDEGLNRAEYGKWIVIAMNLPIDSKEESLFNDMADYKSYVPYINALKKAGITSGTGAGGYSPGKPITRYEAVSMAVSVYKKVFPNDNGSCDAITFADKGLSNSKVNLLKQASKLCITNGSGTSFYPDVNIIRADAVLMINRALKRSHSGNLECVYDENIKFNDVKKTTKYYYDDVYEAASTHYCINK